MPTAQRVEVAIIGAGFSGLGTAIHLDRAGIRDWAILERGADIGDSSSLRVRASASDSFVEGRSHSGRRDGAEEGAVARAVRLRGRARGACAAVEQGRQKEAQGESLAVEATSRRRCVCACTRRAPCGALACTHCPCTPPAR